MTAAPQSLPDGVARELYRSANLLVRAVPGADRSRWVVTFDHYDLGPGLDRAGFGELFLKEHGVSAVHILGAGNDWYQYPDLSAALAAVRPATGAAARLVTYGVSMGGYAALRCAGALRADAVLALSPQYSIDPAVTPWERRWPIDARRIAWRPELRAPIRAACRPILIYDPRTIDRDHAALIAAEVPSVLIEAPHAAHPVSTFLGEVHLLRDILFDVVHDRFDAALTQRRVRDARRRSSVILANLAASQPPSRIGTAVRIARAAAAIPPGSELGQLGLARLLARAGQLDEALQLFDAISIATNRAPESLQHQADALVAAGELPRAMMIADEVVRALPNRADLLKWSASIQSRGGRHTPAFQQQRRAVRLDPGNIGSRRVLRKYRVLWLLERAAALLPVGMRARLRRR